MPIDNGFSVNGVLKELINEKQDGKQEFDVSNDCNRVNNKNRHMQVPNGHRKQTKNALMNVVQCGIGSGGYESR